MLDRLLGELTVYGELQRVSVSLVPLLTLGRPLLLWLWQVACVIFGAVVLTAFGAEQTSIGLW